MPYYQYTAVDPNGRQVNGQVAAPNANEALRSLMTQGLQSPRILSESAGQSAAPRRAQSAQQIIQQSASPSVGVRAPLQQGPIQINVPAAPAAAQTHYTKRSSDKDIYFLFSQIAEQLRAGIGPMQAFSELAQLYKDPKYRESLAAVAMAASEGRAISNVMDLWPDLYPQHVVGLMRAGEVGGFLPDAAATIAEQAYNAHKFKRFHAWFVWVLVINLLSIPLAYMFRQALVSYRDQVETQSQQGLVNGDMFAVFRVMGHLLIWPWGLIFILLIGGSLLLRRYLSSRQMRNFRHEVALRSPVLGKRARDESSTIFSWTLSRLTRSGIPPHRAWEMAMNAVPNEAMKAKLETAGSIMNEGSRLSDVIFKSELFPQEYAPMIATGELTGDVPGALDRLSQVSKAEYDVGTRKSYAFTSTLGFTTLIATTGFVMIVLTYMYAHDFIGYFTNQANGNTGSTQSVTTPSSGNSSTGNSSDQLTDPDQ
jgi:type II secretory pathway component PulF